MLKRLIPAVWLLLVSISSFAQQAQHPCQACRDVRQFPKDYGNHAFNEVFLTAEEDALPLFSTSVHVVNSQGMYATVHINRILVSSGVMIGFYPGILSYQVPYPSPYVQIFVQDPWGTSTTYVVLADSPPLLVGDPFIPLETQPEPEPEPVTSNRIPGGEELLGGYDGTANYFGGATIPYYNFQLMNE